MPLLPFYLRRPAAILKMPEAIARGLTVTGFIRDLDRSIGTYRRTLMLADWRSQANIEAKKDLIKYVRKDRLPSMNVIADVEWEFHKNMEYMYKIKVWTQLRPDEPLTERFANLMSDKPLTPAQIEQQAISIWGEKEQYLQEQLKRVELIGAYKGIPIAED